MYKYIYINSNRLCLKICSEWAPFTQGLKKYAFLLQYKNIVIFSKQIQAIYIDVHNIYCVYMLVITLQC